MQRGGKREGAGRKKTTAKSFAFRAPQDIVDILEGKSMTEYICKAILYYHEHGEV